MGGDGCVEEIQLCRCEPVAWVTVWWVCSLHGGLDPRPRINFTRKTVRLAGSLMNSAQGWSYISVPLCTTHVYTCCHFIVAAAATHTQCCQLISKSSFSRQCVGRIRDTCSQLTWNLHTHTHPIHLEALFDLTWAMVKLCIYTIHAKTNLKFVNRRRRRLTSASPVYPSYSRYTHPVDMKLTYIHSPSLHWCICIMHWVNITSVSALAVVGNSVALP